MDISYSPALYHKPRERRVIYLYEWCKNERTMSLRLCRYTIRPLGFKLNSCTKSTYTCIHKSVANVAPFVPLVIDFLRLLHLRILLPEWGEYSPIVQKLSELKAARLSGQRVLNYWITPIVKVAWKMLDYKFVFLPSEENSPLFVFVVVSNRSIGRLLRCHFVAALRTYIEDNLCNECYYERESRESLVLPFPSSLFSPRRFQSREWHVMCELRNNHVLTESEWESRTKSSFCSSFPRMFTLSRLKVLRQCRELRWQVALIDCGEPCDSPAIFSSTAYISNKTLRNETLDVMKLKNKAVITIIKSAWWRRERTWENTV